MIESQKETTYELLSEVHLSLQSGDIWGFSLCHSYAMHILRHGNEFSYKVCVLLENTVGEA